MVRRNVGQVRGEGVDMTIHTVNVNGSFGWQSSYIFSYNRNWVKKYYLKTYQASTYVSAPGGLVPIVGNPVYGIYSYRSAGLNPVNGNPRGYLNGQISENYTAITGSGTSIYDAIYHGSATPKYFGSTMQRISYRQWALDLNITYKFAYFFKARTINYTSLFNNYIQHTDYQNRWQKPGDESLTHIPSMVYPNVNGRDNFNANTEDYVQPADHVRLQFVNLSYQFQTTDKSVFKQLRLGLQASNLGVLWRKNKLGLDPAFSDLMPEQRTLAFSLSCKL